MDSPEGSQGLLAIPAHTWRIIIINQQSIASKIYAIPLNPKV